jgi:hypothetical protein
LSLGLLRRRESARSGRRATISSRVARPARCSILRSECHAPRLSSVSTGSSWPSKWDRSSSWRHMHGERGLTLVRADRLRHAAPAAQRAALARVLHAHLAAGACAGASPMLAENPAPSARRGRRPAWPPAPSSPARRCRALGAVRARLPAALAAPRSRARAGRCAGRLLQRLRRTPAWLGRGSHAACRHRAPALAAGRPWGRWLHCLSIGAAGGPAGATHHERLPVG